MHRLDHRPGSGYPQPLAPAGTWLRNQAAGEAWPGA